MGWFELGLVSMGLYTFQTFLFKVAADRKCNSSLFMLFFMLTAGGLALGAYFFNPTPILNLQLLLIYGISQVTFYLLRQVSKIEAMKFIPGVIVLPISSTQSIIAVFLGIFLLLEKITTLQFLGIILAFSSIIVLSQNKEKKSKLKNFKLGLVLSIVSAIAGGAANFISKLATSTVNKFLFITVSYYSALLPLYFFQCCDVSSTKASKSESMKLGFYAGLFNFAAFSLFLFALSQGPLSILLPLVDLNLLFAVVVIVLVYKEKITLSRIVGVLLAVISLFLLRE